MCKKERTQKQLTDPKKKKQQKLKIFKRNHCCLVRNFHFSTSYFAHCRVYFKTELCFQENAWTNPKKVFVWIRLPKKKVDPMQKHRCHKFPNNRKVVSFTGNYPRPQVGLFFSGLGQWGGSEIFTAEFSHFLMTNVFDFLRSPPKNSPIFPPAAGSNHLGVWLFFSEWGAEKNSPN